MTTILSLKRPRSDEPTTPCKIPRVNSCWAQLPIELFINIVNESYLCEGLAAIKLRSVCHKYNDFFKISFFLHTFSLECHYLRFLGFQLQTNGLLSGFAHRILKFDSAKAESLIEKVDDTDLQSKLYFKLAKRTLGTEDTEGKGTEGTVATKTRQLIGCIQDPGLQFKISFLYNKIYEPTALLSCVTWHLQNSSSPVQILDPLIDLNPTLAFEAYQTLAKQSLQFIGACEEINKPQKLLGVDWTESIKLLKQFGDADHQLIDAICFELTDYLDGTSPLKKEQMDLLVLELMGLDLDGAEYQGSHDIANLLIPFDRTSALTFADTLMNRVISQLNEEKSYDEEYASCACLIFAEFEPHRIVKFHQELQKIKTKYEKRHLEMDNIRRMDKFNSWVSLVHALYHPRDEHFKFKFDNISKKLLLKANLTQVMSIFDRVDDSDYRILIYICRNFEHPTLIHRLINSFKSESNTHLKSKSSFEVRSMLLTEIAILDFNQALNLLNTDIIAPSFCTVDNKGIPLLTPLPEEHYSLSIKALRGMPTYKKYIKGITDYNLNYLTRLLNIAKAYQERKPDAKATLAQLSSLLHKMDPSVLKLKLDDCFAFLLWQDTYNAFQFLDKIESYAHKIKSLDLLLWLADAAKKSRLVKNDASRI